MAHNGKYPKPSESFAAAMLRMAFLLLCLLMLSVYLMGGLLAKYNATATGSAQAQVAGIDCDIRIDAIDFVFNPAPARINALAVIHKITITNNSEVSYTCTLTPSVQNIPEQYRAAYTLHAPRDFPSVKCIENDSLGVSTLGDLYMEIAEGKVYYAIPSNEGDVWHSLTVENGEVSIPLGLLEIGASATIKVAYFIDLTKGVNFTVLSDPDAMPKLHCEVICEQVD
ncbi:MAG: hypothetical protein IKY59_00680 [Oscillospiraceae bacterium]|nr:hypothetical protein [Oscillospiraceae bacterium]